MTDKIVEALYARAKLLESQALNSSDEKFRTTAAANAAYVRELVRLFTEGRL